MSEELPTDLIKAFYAVLPADQRTARFTPGERQDIAKALRHHVKSIADRSRRNRLETLASEWEQKL